MKEIKSSKFFHVFRLGFLLWALPGLCLAQVSNSTQTVAEKKFERLAHALRSPDESVRLEAIQELGSSHDPASIPLFLQGLQDKNTTVRSAAESGLLLYHGPQVASALRPLLNDEDDRLRAAAVWSLSHVGGRAVLPDVVRLATNDASGIVRFRAVCGLAFCGDRSALPVVVDALGDYNNAVRERSALLALDVLADRSVAPLLLNQRHNVLPATRRLVMYLLAKYGDSSVIPGLVEGLNDPDALVRAEAAISLGKLRSLKNLDALQPLLKDPDDHVRGSTAYAIGLMGDPLGAALLRSSLQDNSAFVRAVAAESLQKLGDKTVRPPEGFRAAALFTFPIYSFEKKEVY